MASNQPLLSHSDKSPKKSVGPSKASIFYSADGYLEQLHKQAALEAPELDELVNNMHDMGRPAKAGGILAVTLNEEGRSPLTNRLFPEALTPDIDGRYRDLKFLFTKIKDNEALYMWKFMAGIFFSQICMIFLYAALLRYFGIAHWGTISACWGVPFAWLCIQHIYVCHDVMHGATFPPYWWMKFITHPLSDFFSLPWEEFILEHNRHHASTVDLLTQGEFGWDPEMPLYWLGKPGRNVRDTEHTPEEGPNKIHFESIYICRCVPLWLFTMWLVPVIHFFGLNDTGAAFCLEWYLNFPETDGMKCHTDFWGRFLPRRIKHHAWVLGLWYSIYLLGSLVLGEGLWFMLGVSCAARAGYGSAWMMITNFTHSHWWNELLADDSKTVEMLRNNGGCFGFIMSVILGGRHRWNEMLFHDLHHAFPNKVGTLSQRGRFHGWKKVHDAAEEVIRQGLFKKNGDAETKMEKAQKKRSMIASKRRSTSKN